MSCVLCPAELLVTIHMNETDRESLEEALSKKLRVLEVLLGSNQERTCMRGVIAGFRHKFKGRAVAPVNALTQGSEWGVSHLLTPTNHYQILSELRWVYPCPLWCASRRQLGWEAEGTEFPVPLTEWSAKMSQ